MVQAAISGGNALTAYTKPLPKLDPWNRPFWEATQAGKFLIQRDHDGNCWFPPSPVSPYNRSSLWTWEPVSGRGIVVSWVIFHQNYFPGFADERPYNVAVVQLEEGPRVITNLVNVSNDAIHIGMKVHLTFRAMNGAIQLPVFTPTEAA